MDFKRPRGPFAFALAVGLRATGIGLLVFAAAALAVERQFYATAVILVGAAIVLGFDVARTAAGVDRMLAQFVDGLIAEGHERPAPPAAGAVRLTGSIEKALDRLARARAERQRRIDYLQTLADNVQAAILVVDEAGIVEFANRAARQRLGEVGGPLARLAALGPAAGVLAEALAGSRTVTVLADGQRVLASTAAFTSPGGARRLISLQSIWGDLDAVEQGAWHDLVRILSHEMMNSLTPVLSLAETMAALVEQGRTREVAEAVEVIARRSAGLMNFVERYRRLADLPPAARIPVRLAEFTGRIDRLMSGMMAERGVAYQSRVTPPDLALDADPDLLEQAVINLVKNALEAVAGVEGPVVRLACRAAPDGVVIVVEDNGPGLTPADAEAAFVPFFTTKAGGSGIGLSLARQIALAHHGRIEHAPVEPHGAAFRLWIPTVAA